MQLLTIPPEKQMASKPLPSSVAKSFRGHDKPIHGSAPPSTVFTTVLPGKFNSEFSPEVRDRNPKGSRIVFQLSFFRGKLFN